MRHFKPLAAAACVALVAISSACSPAGREHFEPMGNAICSDTARKIASQAAAIDAGEAVGDQAGVVTVSLVNAMRSERKALGGLTPPPELRGAWNAALAHYDVMTDTIEKRLTGKTVENDLVHPDHLDQYRLTMAAFGLTACATRGNPFPGQTNPIGNGKMEPLPGSPIPDGTMLLPGVEIDGYETAPIPGTES